MTTASLAGIMSELYTRAEATGEPAEATLSRGLRLRARCGPPRELLLYRDATTPPSAQEAVICAVAAGFPAHTTEPRASGRALLVTEQPGTDHERAERDRYHYEPNPGPWRPGRPLPADGKLSAGRLYGIDVPPDGYATFIIDDTNASLRIIRGTGTDEQVTRGAARELIAGYGYAPAVFTIDGRLV